MAANNKGPAKPELSAREQEVLMAAWNSIKGADPQASALLLLPHEIDFEKLATMLNLKNAHTASTIFYNLKKKVKQYGEQHSGGSGESQLQSRGELNPSTGAAAGLSPARKRGRPAGSTNKTPKRIKAGPAVIEDEDDGAI